MAVADPRKLSASGEAQFGERYYARLYAVRSVPIELASAVIPIVMRGNCVALLLVATAAIQAAVAVIGVTAGKRSMIVGASVAAIVHVVCATVTR